MSNVLKPAEGVQELPKGVTVPPKVQADIKKIVDEEGKDLLDNMPKID